MNHLVPICIMLHLFICCYILDTTDFKMMSSTWRNCGGALFGHLFALMNCFRNRDLQVVCCQCWPTWVLSTNSSNLRLLPGPQCPRPYLMVFQSQHVLFQGRHHLPLHLPLLMMQDEFNPAKTVLAIMTLFHHRQISILSCTVMKYVKGITFLNMPWMNSLM